MRIKVLLVALGTFVGLATMGSSCINEGFLVTANMSPVTLCATPNPGGTWNDSTGQINISSLVDESYRDKIKGYRLYDIRLRAENIPASTTPVSGTVEYKFNNTPPYRLLLTFTCTYSQLAGSGISLLNPPAGAITPTGVPAFIATLATLPQTVQLRSFGSGPPQSGLRLCIEIYAQADAQVN